MAVTQQLARASTEYLEECRRAALASPDGDPGWAPPEGDTLDLDWAIWDLIALCRQAGDRAADLATLEHSIEGDPAKIPFLDHLAFYDRIERAPGLLAPSEVARLAVALARFDLDAALAAAPAHAGPEELAAHFRALREFYEGAARRGLAVVAWVD